MSELALRNRSVNFFSKIHKGVVLNFLVQLFSAFGIGFAAYYFKVQGVDFYKIVLIWAISPLASLPVVLFFNTWNIKRFLQLGLLTYTGMALSLLFYNQYSFALYGIFAGLKLALFSVSLNYVFFKNSTNGSHAKNSSVYFILGPLIGIVLPPIGASVISSWSFQALFFIAGLLSFVPLLYVRGKDFEYKLKIKWRDADKAFAGLKLITFFDGTLHYFQKNFLAVYALLFLNTEYEVSGLLSYLAFLSLIASFMLAYFSDKYQKRVEMLYPILIVMGLLILITPAINSLALFILVVGLYAIFDNLSLPIRFAVPMDFVKMDIGFWRASEFYGNIGRTIVFGSAAWVLYLGNKWVPFIVFALMTLAFPFIISKKVDGLRKRVQKTTATGTHS